MPRLAPQQKTWVMRLYGSAYNPETTCEYTGRQLWQASLDPETIAYLRDDGYWLAVRPTTPEEKAWIAANPVAYQQERGQVIAWLSTRKDYGKV